MTSPNVSLGLRASRPQIPEPYALLALIFNDIGKLREALQFYKLASTRDPKQLGHHREVARIAGILGDNESRLEALKLLTRLQPTNLNAAIERARCLFDLQKPKQVTSVLTFDLSAVIVSIRG